MYKWMKWIFLRDSFETENHLEKALVMGVPAVVCIVCLVICRKLGRFGMWGFGLEMFSLEVFRLTIFSNMFDIVILFFIAEAYIAMMIWMNRITRARHKYVRHSMEGDAP